MTHTTGSRVWENVALCRDFKLLRVPRTSLVKYTNDTSKKRDPLDYLLVLTHCDSGSLRSVFPFQSDAESALFVSLSLFRSEYLNKFRIAVELAIAMIGITKRN